MSVRRTEMRTAWSDEGSKQLVRNGVTVPPRTIHEYPEEPIAQSEDAIVTEVKTVKSAPDLAAPKLFSSLRIAKSIDKQGSRVLKEQQSLRTVKLQKPQSSQPKGLKTINIPFDKQIYKGLVDLQVSEEDIGIVPNAPMKAKEFVKTKEEEPVLSDYYKPVFDREYIIKPNPPLFDVQPQTHFTGKSVLNASKRWESIEKNVQI